MGVSLSRSNGVHREEESEARLTGRAGKLAAKFRFEELEHYQAYPMGWAHNKTKSENYTDIGV
jgi:hypothetical protein